MSLPSAAKGRKRVVLLLVLLVLNMTLANDPEVSVSPLVQGLWPGLRVLERLAVTQGPVKGAAGGDACSSHARELVTALQNASLWAVKMVDAAGSLPSGVISGNSFSLGDFDECVETRGGGGGGIISGQYCLATVRVDGLGEERTAPRAVTSALERPDPHSSAWDVLQPGGERWRRPRHVLHAALCVPHTCNSTQVQRAAQEAFGPPAARLGATLNFSVPSTMCSVQSDLTLSASDIVFCVVAACFVFLVLVSSVHDQLMRPPSPSDTSSPQESVGWRVFHCFAVRKHVSSLSQVEEGENDLNFLFGLRLSSILVVILSHKSGFTLAGPLKNPEYMEQMYSQLQYMFSLHADLVVDTFFFLAGFLLTVGMLRNLRNHATSSSSSRDPSIVGPLYFFRFMRLTPAYMLVVFFYATLLPKLGDGPLWNTLVLPEQRFCADNWWTNLLYLNNYVNVDRMCIEQAWYMPCDMHFFLVSVPVLLLVHRHPRRGFALLIFLTLASVLTPLVLTWSGGHDATLLFMPDFLKNTRQHAFFGSMYIKSHVRASPYFIGVWAAWLFLRQGDRRLSQAKAVPLFLAGVAVCVAILLSGALFYNIESGVATSTVMRALYAATHRSVWALGLACSVLACALGRLNWVKALLSWRPLVPLSKLSYGAYLIHVVVLWYGAGSVREPIYVNSFLIVVRSWSDTVLTFILAFLLFVFVEAPIRDLTKVLILLGAPVKKLPTVEINGNEESPEVADKNVVVYSL